MKKMMFILVVLLCFVMVSCEIESDEPSEGVNGCISKITYLKSIFGEDINIYTNKEENPYNVDLNKYGNNVSAYFYEPDFVNNNDPYININKEEFYNNYSPASSYEDAVYRTKHNLMSGDISEQYYLPVEGKIVEGEKAVRLTDALYILDTKGNYLAYVTNSIDENYNIIYYNGAYISLNEISAYLLAFGSAPANQISKKGSDGMSRAISLWGKYGRVNDSEFYGTSSNYPHEPALPTNDKVLYHEIDFGTTGCYTTKNSNGYNKTQTIYNNGTKITRGAARLVYVADKNVTKIDDRFVFYTYTHYNDFQEYLNYQNGWGIRFGNESAGNEYCSGKNDYYALHCLPPTQYSEVVFKALADL